MGSFYSTCCTQDEDKGHLPAGLVTGRLSPLLGTPRITSPGGKSRASSLGDGVGYQAHETGFVENARGLNLFWQKYTPLSTEPSALILFLHGIHEHSARYDHVFEQLAIRLDCLVVSFDHQSHGRSDDVRGLRGACDSFEHFVDDAMLVLDTVREDQLVRSLPVYIWGQSFGGLVASHLALRPEAKSFIKGLMLSSPALNVEWNLTLRVQARAAKVTSALTPDVAMVPAVRPEDMSKCPKAVEDYVNDPLNTIGNLRCRVGAETLQAFKDLEKRHDEVDVENLLVLFGDTDRCCSLSAAKTFVNGVKSQNKELKIFENMYHTLFHEPEQQQAIDYLVNFIEKTNVASTNVVVS